jgi:LUD domain
MEAKGIHVVTDDGWPAHDLDAFDGVITGAAVAIAETGTMVLDGSPDQGRRAITLVPDYHLCIVRPGRWWSSSPRPSPAWPRGLSALSPGSAGRLPAVTSSWSG